MKFGLGYLTTQIPPDDSRVDFGRYRDTMELVQLAEDVGFDSVWVSEEHGRDDRYLSSVLPMCAAIAQATDHVRIGTAIALAPLYEPLRLAESAATIDILSGGRFTLGLGIGYRDWEFDWFDVDKSERVPRIRDCIRFCRRGWEGDRFSFDGEIFEYEDVRVTPTPLQGSDLPIVYGAQSEPGIRRAARETDGVIFVHSHSLDELESMQSWCRDENPGPDFETMVVREVGIADTEQEAWERIREGSFYVNRTYEEEYTQSSDDVEIPDPKKEGNARSWALCGDPEELADRLVGIEESLGPDVHLIARLEFPGMSHEVAMDAVERFGTEVIPRVKNQ